uniref:Uncharacterized protein n=1 Tax=Tetraselmis sp. GSL018 TaxID=582737 RepID=A0A061RUA7_9CHLO
MPPARRGEGTPGREDGIVDRGEDGSSEEGVCGVEGIRQGPPEVEEGGVEAPQWGRPRHGNFGTPPC